MYYVETVPMPLLSRQRTITLQWYKKKATRFQVAHINYLFFL